ncbi:MAG TPA: UDP-N-acetylmuramoyl-tripeptide--D-alanyl-D-alanine ligase [Gaiella sp.]|uniref:UDP-N-acetylmuramoyl-tripeptide--D-alanyl-D- alanine ligase n=1 Tax=Gaiella sp. TaxID=2663207 RepID=UPI002D80242C|nr:UDP-N-acetylmuramoyl-tripeptide--D-alanyl-D-alanine ligase [Gaiella sp.]HET9288325.1 UDP-N-acetylmuramoyl-tripeptide--D-alanyl-D-alanine ligase [Gaiella sp.]
MIPLAWAEVEGLELGALRGKPEDGVVRRVHDDSRRARPGDLFVAINTGTRFVEDALALGAATLVPRDQHAALAALARLVRDRSEAQVVAVVGSTGKTTTKDALAALCAAVTPTVAADASRNNEIGLPLTVLRLEPDTRVLVTEMGMRGAGQVAELCGIARPTLSLVTSIGPEHLELVGTLEDVARANAEALEALPAGGIAVVPAGEPLLDPYLDRSDLDVRFFDPTSPTRDGDRWRFRVGGEELRLELPFTQRHLAGNVHAALTAYQALGLPLGRAHEGAGAIRLSRWRGEVHDLPGGGFVVNDAYNANPTSMRAALVDLAERAGGRRRVAILGQMAELGEESDRYHSDVAALLRELGIEVVVAVGEPARGYLAQIGDGVHVADTTGFDAIAEVLRPGDAILVKGSRSVGLEGIPALIQKHSRAWSES